jgi:hypothetical protein
MYGKSAVSRIANAAGHDGGRVSFRKCIVRWNAVRLLYCGGAMLVILGLSGILGLLGSLSPMALFNPPRWINWIHLSFGAFLLVVARIGNKKLQLGLVLLAAVAGTAIGLAGLLVLPHVASRSGMQDSRDFSDPLAHLTVGTMAIWALRNSKREDRAVRASAIS